MVGSPRQRLAFALKYASLAPTEIDWQPWEFRLADSHLELIAKDDPALEAMDPDGRELMIGCGAVRSTRSTPPSSTAYATPTTSRGNP